MPSTSNWIQVITDSIFFFSEELLVALCAIKVSYRESEKKAQLNEIIVYPS
jgi:hypothetical protein